MVLAVLAYHKIGPPPADGWDTWFYVGRETFAGHLRHLAEAGWQVVDLTTALAGLDDPAALPQRAALLTFDDGYRSMRNVTLPLLRRLDWPAVLFVPSDHIGRTSAFDPNEPVEPLCDADDLRALAAAGVAVQSHGASHRPFSTLDDDALVAELSRSKQALEATVGQSVGALAYPYGDAAAGACRTHLARSGYRAAFGYGGGLVHPPVGDRFAVPRLAIGPDTDLRAALRDG